MAEPKAHRQLPTRLAEIHDRPGDPPLATIDECRAIRTYLKNMPLRMILSEIQHARKAGVRSEYDRLKEQRERLKWIADDNEQRLAKSNCGEPEEAEMKFGRERAEECADGKRWENVRPSDESAWPGSAQDDPGQAGTSHSPDFTSVLWFGKKYLFAKGQQAEAVRVLWGAWKAGGHTLSELTIGGRIGSTNDHFRLIHVFTDRSGRRHPAWNSMITRVNKGVYCLAEPAAKRRSPE